MGHEIEEVIRLKTLQAEQMPVEWNKQRVWLSLTVPKKTRKRNLPYAVAATIMLLLAASLYVLRIQNSDLLQERLAALQKGIQWREFIDKQTQLSVNKPEKTTCTGSAPPFVEIVSARHSHDSLRKPPINVPRSVGTTSQRLIIDDRNVTSVIQDSIQREPDVVRTLPTEKTIDAIVGVVPPMGYPRRNKKRGHLKINVDFNPEPSPVVAAAEKGSFTARLN